MSVRDCITGSEWPFCGGRPCSPSRRLAPTTSVRPAEHLQAEQYSPFGSQLGPRRRKVGPHDLVSVPARRHFLHSSPRPNASAPPPFLGPPPSGFPFYTETFGSRQTSSLCRPRFGKEQFGSARPIRKPLTVMENSCPPQIPRPIETCGMG